MKKTVKKETTLSILKDIKELLKANNTFLAHASIDKTVKEEEKSCKFTVWKTLTVGHCATVEDLKKEITDKGMFVSSWAEDLMKQQSFLSSTQTLCLEYDLALVSVSDLGFPIGTTYAEICKSATDQGLALCPPEIGPYLRLAYADQPTSEWIRIGMEAITDSHGSPDVFSVERLDDGAAWLTATMGGRTITGVGTVGSCSCVLASRPWNLDYQNFCNFGLCP